jgi:hypothetical protein
MSAFGETAEARIEAALDPVRELWKVLERLDQALFDERPPDFYSREEAAWKDLEAAREELGRLQETLLGPWKSD